MTRGGRIALGALAAWGVPALAQQPDASWLDGAPPRQGSFAFVAVRPAGEAPLAVHGTLNGVPLQFERAGDGRFVALAGVTLNARDSVRLRARVAYAGGRSVTDERWLPVTTASFPSEALSVAPEFSRTPDSALAARIARDNARAAAVSRAALRTARLWRGPFLAPRESRITSGYGMGRLFNGELTSRHLGVDFDGAMGTPVRAAGRGVVALVADFYYAGHVVYLNHGGGLVTAYFHLSQALVTEGDTVNPGEVLGRVGRSGRVTGPHLHWVTKYGNASLDGTTLLALPALAADTAR